MSDISILRGINVLAGLGELELMEIARRLIPLKIEKGERLFYRNDVSSGIYFVTEGSFQVIIDNDASREIIVYTIKKGDIIGEMALFNNNLRSATAVALEKSRLFKISNEQFVEVMRLYPDVAVNFSRILIDRLLAANETIERLGAMDGTERVTSYIRSLARREGAREKNGDYILSVRPTYQQISQRLGISEKTIYRTMRHLADEGKIQITGRKLIAKVALLGKD